MTPTAAEQDLTEEQREVAARFALSPEQWKERLRPRPLWFLECLDQVLRNDTDQRIQLPSFPDAKDLAIFSDYGGDHKESPVFTYTFLVVDFGGLAAFGNEAKQIRAAHNLGAREISFKELNSTAIQACVPKLMRAADMLPGLLFTLVVNKSYKTILGSDQALEVVRCQLDTSGIRSWRKLRELESTSGRPIRLPICSPFWLERTWVFCG